jgi:hypothetical protein
MHFAMKDDPLAEALAVLILDFQAAKGASPFLHGGVRHWGLASLCLPSGRFGYISFSGLKPRLIFLSGEKKSGVTGGCSG